MQKAAWERMNHSWKEWVEDRRHNNAQSLWIQRWSSEWRQRHPSMMRRCVLSMPMFLQCVSNTSWWFRDLFGMCPRCAGEISVRWRYSGAALMMFRWSSGNVLVLFGNVIVLCWCELVCALTIFVWCSGDGRGHVGDVLLDVGFVLVMSWRCVGDVSVKWW